MDSDVDEQEREGDRRGNSRDGSRVSSRRNDIGMSSREGSRGVSKSSWGSTGVASADEDYVDDADAGDDEGGIDESLVAEGGRERGGGSGTSRGSGGRGGRGGEWAQEGGRDLSRDVLVGEALYGVHPILNALLQGR